jgi:hypothetical protein
MCVNVIEFPLFLVLSGKKLPKEKPLLATRQDS